MFSRLVVLISAGCLVWAGAANAAGDKGWICTADAATGFMYKNGKWAPTTFNVKNKRYTVTKKKIGRKSKYHVTKMGDKISTPCKSDTPDKGGLLFCKSFGEMKINTKDLRYMFVFPWGYWMGKDNNENTPFIEIGKCALL